MSEKRRVALSRIWFKQNEGRAAIQLSDGINRAIVMFAVTILWGCGQQSATYATGETQTAERGVAVSPADEYPAFEATRAVLEHAGDHDARWAAVSFTSTHQRWKPTGLQVGACWTGRGLRYSRWSRPSCLFRDSSRPSVRRGGRSESSRWKPCVRNRPEMPTW